MEAYPQSTVHALLAACERRPEHPFLLFEGRSWSFAEVREAAAAWAGLYRTRGLATGDRVALFLGNAPEFVAAYLGAHMAGAIVVLVNTAYRHTELRHILADSGARVVVTEEQLLPGVAGLRGDLPELTDILVSTPRPMHPEPKHGAWCMVHSEDVALIGYTSGTTGRSKGAMLTHGNLMANSAAVTRAWRWTADDRLLLALPLFHIHGLGVGLHGALLTGSTVDLRRGFDAAEVLATLARGETTMFFGVPTMYTRLIQEARRRTEERSPKTEDGVGRDDAPRSSVLGPRSPVRLFVSGSAPLAPQTFAEFEALFGQRILERYGMTETVMNLTNPYDGERRPGTVGVPFPGQEARVVDVRTRAPLPDGEVGEIQVRGPHVFKGYWRNPAATAEAFDPEGWFNTGDLGWRSPDGYFSISGRARELIISGGYNIYPREVEKVLERHPLVAEVAVLGLPDAEFGELVAAVVVLSAACRLQLAACDEEQRQSLMFDLQSGMIDWCREHLASYKKPRRVVFVDALPRNALGKVQKHLLRERLTSPDL
ncbi:MAG TPA: acyl-CoA synthetase [Roseiflexaceae bacterium]|nr:acyl-CoA synthetase [Roseiflexaceae bacterium]